MTALELETALTGSGRINLLRDALSFTAGLFAAVEADHKDSPRAFGMDDLSEPRRLLVESASALEKIIYAGAHGRLEARKADDAAAKAAKP